MATKLPIAEADFLAELHGEMKWLGLSTRDEVRMLGLLIHQLCKYEGRALTPDFLANIFNKCQAAQMEHQVTKELDDCLLSAHLYELADERQALNG